jgi:hypothetical protein
MSRSLSCTWPSVMPMSMLRSGSGPAPGSIRASMVISAAWRTGPGPSSPTSGQELVVPSASSRRSACRPSRMLRSVKRTPLGCSKSSSMRRSRSSSQIKISASRSLASATPMSKRSWLGSAMCRMSLASTRMPAWLPSAALMSAGSCGLMKSMKVCVMRTRATSFCRIASGRLGSLRGVLIGARAAAAGTPTASAAAASATSAGAGDRKQDHHGGPPEEDARGDRAHVADGRSPWQGRSKAARRRLTDVGSIPQGFARDRG